jgi:hypothetical protein
MFNGRNKKNVTSGTKKIIYLSFFYFSRKKESQRYVFSKNHAS